MPAAARDAAQESSMKNQMLYRRICYKFVTSAHFSIGQNSFSTLIRGVSFERLVSAPACQENKLRGIAIRLNYFTLEDSYRREVGRMEKTFPK